MLCDLMLERWINNGPDVQLFSKVNQANALKDAGASDEDARAVLTEQDIIDLKDYLQRFEEAPHLCGKGSIPFSDIGMFQERLRSAHKFTLTPAFISASFEHLATPETILKAKDWFALIHNPMWLEWLLPNVKLRFGALLYSKPVAGGNSATMCYFIHGKAEAETGMQWYEVYHFRIFPDSLQQEHGKFRMDIEDVAGLSMDEEQLQHMSSMAIFDFIVRLNSPRITDFRPTEDLSRLNKKRAQLGRLPLCSYQVVDLNKDIKHYLKQAGSESDYGVRFHWRRGHFKVRKTGVFWWSPHTAGRKTHGEIHKDYIA